MSLPSTKSCKTSTADRLGGTGSSANFQGLADLTDIVQELTEYRLTEAELADLTSISKIKIRQRCEELAAEELQDLKQKLPLSADILLLPKDAADEKCDFEVRAGTGGDEAALFATDGPHVPAVCRATQLEI